MNKYWSNRPKTYLANSELRPEYKNVEVINAGKDAEWSKKVQIALEHIETRYVLLMLEDFYVSDYVDDAKVIEALELAKKYDIKYYQILVQLIKQSWTEGRPFNGNKHVRIIPCDKKYGINLQTAIWDKEFLKQTVGMGNYNAWQFEMNQLGTKDYNVEKIEYLINDSNILNITHAVVQSKYLRGAIRKLKKQNYNIDLNERAILSKKENFKYVLKLFMYSVTPKCLVKPFKKIGKLMKVDFVTDRLMEQKESR